MYATKRKIQVGFAGMLISMAIVLAGVGGWVWNIVKLVNTSFTGNETMVIARAVGIFVAPLGAILGFV